MDFIFLLVIIAPICGLIGAFCGKFKDRTGLGFALGFFLGPIGWILVLLIPAAPSGSEQLSVYERDDARRIARLRQLDEAKRLAAQTVATEEKSRTWRIAKGTADLGSMDLAGIKLKLRSGELTPQDFYFDESKSDWVPLAEHRIVFPPTPVKKSSPHVMDYRAGG